MDEVSTSVAHDAPLTEDSAWALMCSDAARGLAWAQAVRQQPDQADATRELAGWMEGCCQFALGNYAEARVWLTRPLPDPALPWSRLVRTHAMACLGLIECRADEREAGLARLEQAAAAGEGAPNRPGAMARMYWGIGLNEVGRPADAGVRLNEALQVFLTLGDTHGERLCRGNLGNVHMRLRDYDAAAEQFHAYERIARQAGDRRALALSRASLGELYESLGDPHAALERYDEAAQAFGALGRRLETVISWKRCGDVLLRLRRWPEAEARFEKMLGVEGVETFIAFHAAGLAGRGLARAAQGRGAEATEDFRGALALAKTPATRAEILLHLAVARACGADEAGWEGLPGRREALVETAAAADTDVAPPLQQQAIEFLVDDAEQGGDHAEALAWQRRLSALREKLWEQRARDSVARAEVSFRLEKAEREIALARAHAQQLERALDEAQAERERARRANAEKTELLAVLAHDVRNPVTHIALAADMVSTLSGDAEVRDLCSDIQHSARTAERIIRTTLDDAAVAEGRFRISAGEVDLRACIHAVFEAAAPQAARRGHEVVEVPGGPLRVWADARRLEQALRSVVEGCLKTCPPGTRMQVAAEPVEARARVVVEILGCGADPSASRDGCAADCPERLVSGPSLTVAKVLVEAMRGQLRSQPGVPGGRGCRFEIDLPCGPA